MSIRKFSVLASASLCAFLLAACNEEEDPTATAQTAVKVSVAAVSEEDITSETSFIGKGEAIDSVEIIARVQGFLEEKVIEDGAVVQEGDLLFRIESSAYDATLSARQADLASAEANVELAEIELDRKTQLVARDTAPESELDVAKANAKVAESAVLAANAAIEEAQLNVDYTEVYAPFEGRIGRIGASVGDLVGPSSGTLVTVVRQSPIYVSFSLNEKQLVNVLENLDASIGELSEPTKSPDVYLILPNGQKLDEVGKIVFADNRIDPTTGTISIRAEFANEAGLIVDGQFLTVDILASEPESQLLIPQAAVQRDQKGDFALVVNTEGVVEQRYITLNGQHEISYIVADGIQIGENVIVEGLQRVRPGVTVDAVPAATAPADVAPAEEG